MPTGLRALRKIQAGRQGDFNIPVAPVRYLVGRLDMELTQDAYAPDDLEIGSLATTPYTIAQKREASLSFTSDCAYNQIDEFLDMAVGNASPGGQGATWVPNYSSAAASHSQYTFFYGDDIQCWETSSVFCPELEISGSVGEVVSLQADLIGRDMLAMPNFAVLTSGIEPLEYVTMAHCQFEAGDLGSVSVIPATLIDFSYQVSSGLTPQKYSTLR